MKFISPDLPQSWDLPHLYKAFVLVFHSIKTAVRVSFTKHLPSFPLEERVRQNKLMPDKSYTSNGFSAKFFVKLETKHKRCPFPSSCCPFISSPPSLFCFHLKMPHWSEVYNLRERHVLSGLGSELPNAQAVILIRMTWTLWWVSDYCGALGLPGLVLRPAHLVLRPRGWVLLQGGFEVPEVLCDDDSISQVCQRTSTESCTISLLLRGPCASAEPQIMRLAFKTVKS